MTHYLSGTDLHSSVPGDIERSGKHSTPISYQQFETKSEREIGKALLIQLKNCMFVQTSGSR